MAAPVNYSTTIDAVKTVGEMQQMLAAAGAQRIAVDYQDGVPIGLAFALDTEFGVRLFSMPVNIEGMHALLLKKERQGQLKSGSKATRTSKEQAGRVSWRLMKDWLGAQIAIIESGMVTVEQVMLPYLVDREGRGFFEHYKDTQLMELVTGNQS